MKIENLKELSKVISLCRRTGVTVIEIDNVKLSLGPEPRTKNKHTGSKFSEFLAEANIKIPAYSPVPTEVDSTPDTIKTDELTDEQLLFYSTRPETTEA